MPEPETVRDFRRAQIIGAARRIVARDGLHALTVSALEGELAFTRGVITYHFRNKEEIVQAVLASALADVEHATVSRVRSSMGAAEKIEALLRSTVRGLLDNVEASMVLLSFWGRIPADPEIAELNARLYERYRAYTRDVLAEGVATGDFVPAAASDAVAALVVGIVIGTVAQVCFEAGCIDPDAVVAEAAGAILGHVRHRAASCA
ncbi:MAG: TetR family transcriptional regulator C-terminal domain-containing protein [Candidatus Schekmanbacteria bacterium]|nr:TetR family transcriptional regulator C-terminal domain-containing protein [Candidatus Schekmanbacteria bacterium]